MFRNVIIDIRRTQRTINLEHWNILLTFHQEFSILTGKVRGYHCPLLCPVNTYYLELQNLQLRLGNPCFFSALLAISHRFCTEDDQVSPDLEVRQQSLSPIVCVGGRER